MVERTQNLWELLDEFRGLYQKLLEELMSASDDMKAKKLSTSDLADVGFLCRELERLSDDLRKDCKARKELAGKIISFIVTQESLNDDSANDTVRGELATATPYVKQLPRLPARGSAMYSAFCKDLGVPQNVIDQGVIKIDWKGAIEFVTERMQDGLPLPKGISETYPEFSCVFRRRTKK